MVDRAIGTNLVALGILFLTKTLEITVEDYKVQRLLAITQDVWATKRTCFTAIDAARLIGNVIVCVQVCPWLQRCLHQLLEELKNLLRKNAKRLQRQTHFSELIQEQNEKWLDPRGKSFAKHIFPNRSFMNAVWHCGTTTFYLARSAGGSSIHHHC